MAQERCYRKTYQYGRLWDVGEVRTASKTDEETGEIIASNHFRLLGVDEKIDERDVYDEEKVKETRREAGLRDKKTAILKALDGLDPDDDSHWTRAGDPAIAAVFNMVDFEVSRNEIRAAAPDFDREAARELKS